MANYIDNYSDDAEEQTTSTKVKFLMGVGIILALTGFLVIFVHAIYGVVVMLLASAVITTGVFAQVE